MVYPVRRVPQNGKNDGILRRLFGAGDPVTPKSGSGAAIAITSGKGGTGKSFVATNLAVAMSRCGDRVCIVDCDFGLGNAHLLLGVNPRVTLQHVLTRQVPIEEVVVSTPYGPSLVPAGSGISRLADMSEDEIFVLADGLERLAAANDALLLDTAAGISPQCLLTLMLTRHVVLVTNPEIAALTDAYALIKCLSRQPGRPEISVVINRVPRRGMGPVTFDKLSNVSLRFARCQIHYLGEIPDDSAVTQRRLGQPPLVASHPDCEAAKCIRDILEKLRGYTGGLHRCPLSPREGLVHRVRADGQAGIRN
jgi:flagellar biosynthesis protein FlhG